MTSRGGRGLESEDSENPGSYPEGISLKAPAKLNLYLQVMNKRADGYHNLCSLFQMVGLYDRLSIRETSEGLHLSIEDASLLADSSNLVLRAATLLREEMRTAGLPLRGALIHLVKKIPIAAGMGGGSSDAAATLIGLNRLWGLDWSREKLAELGSRIGSDLPFFFYGPTAWVSGRGTFVDPTSLSTESMMEGVFLLVHPDFAVSTAEVFEAYAQVRARKAKNSQIELTRELPPPTIPSDMRKFPLMETILRYSRNDLERVTLAAHPELDAVKDLLESLGGKSALMSGSGPTIFSFFKDARAANTAAEHMKKEGYHVSVAAILRQSPFEEFL